METMKDSGLKWIGAIPSDWKITRIKYMSSLKGRIGWQGLTSEEYQDKGAYLITGVDFLDGGIDWENCVHVPMKRWEEAKDIQIQNGDLLITKDGTIGKVAIVSDMPGETSLNSGVLRIMPYEGYSRRFLYWVLKSDEFWNWFNCKNAGNSTIVHLYQGDFAEFYYTFPDFQEQERIADYLDKRCAKLDKIIASLERQIELLQKYKKSLITETVTKGLDKNVEMKDSGIEWMPKIPVRWSVKRIKDVCTLQTGTTPTKNIGIEYEKEEDDYWWYTPGDIVSEDYLLRSSERVIEERAVKENGIKLYPIDTVLFVAIGATLGKTGKTQELSYSNQQVTALIPRAIDGNYLQYFMVAAGAYLKETALYTTLPIINNQYLGVTKIVVPPIEEQKSIASMLINKIPKINSILVKKKKLLDIMKTEKAATIFEYVTGKKRVKEVV